MSKALAIHNWDDATALASRLSSSRLVPKPFRDRPEDILLVLMWAGELGIGPAQALGGGFHVIDGKATMSAQMIAALARRHPACEYLRITEHTDKSVTMVTKRREDPQETSLTYTIGDAQKAGLTNRANYSKHPKAMLLARATTQICRAVYPEVCLGIMDEQEAEEVYGTNGHTLAPEPPQIAEVVVDEPMPDLSVTDQYHQRIEACLGAPDGEERMADIATEIKGLDSETKAGLRDHFMKVSRELQARMNNEG